MITKRAFLFSTLLLCALSSHAQNHYKVDSNFGMNGIFTLPATDPFIANYGVDRQADGKLVAAAAFVNNTTYLFDSTCVYRLKVNGTVDSTFGHNGYARGGFPGVSGRGIRVLAMPNGSIAVVGNSLTGPTNDTSRAILHVLTGSGAPDVSFNGGVPVVLAPAGSYGCSVVWSNGKLVTTTLIGDPPSASASIRIARYNLNGTLDATFGVGGLTTLTPGTSYGGEIVTDAAGRFYIPWANPTSPATAVEKAIYRLTANGQLDASWGTAGKGDAIIENTSTMYAYGLQCAVLDNGKVILGSLGEPGSSIPFAQDFTTHRYNAAGHFETSYGTTGTAVATIVGFDNVSRSLYGMVSNGNTVVVYCKLGSLTVGGEEDLALVQLDTAGALDVNFADAGVLRTHIGVVGYPWISKLSNGDLAGACSHPGTKGIVVRYKQTPTGIATINNRMPAAVFPNPSTNNFMLHCERGVLYALYDVAGREVLRGKTVGAETLVNTEGLAAGTYKLVCTDGKRNAELTVVKQ